MRLLKLCGAIILIVMAASCGGNTTKAGVSIIFPTTNPVTVLENVNQQFAATVSGVSTTSVYWQVCLASATSSVQPTVCTPIPGVTITGQTSLTGFGTITQNGLYTAPSAIPQPNLFVVMATSTIDTTAFAIFSVSVASGIQVKILPAGAAILTGEHFQYSATVTGATNPGVSWSVNQTPGGDSTDGYICPNPAAPQPCTAGEYFAPMASPGSVSITATSVQDPTVSFSVSLSVVGGSTPTFTSMDPTTAAEGSVQQEVYVTGSSFFNTTGMQVNGVILPSTDVTFINSALLRVIIPGTLLQQPGPLTVYLVEQNGDTSATSVNLNVIPVRPAVVAVTPDTVSQVTSSTNFSLTGGFFVPSNTLAQFDGSSAGITTSFVDSRHLIVTVPSGSLAIPGLYPLVVQNGDAAAAMVPSLTAKNIAVTPNPSSIATSPSASISVGSNPAAVAIDYATGAALIANTGSGTVSVVNLLPSPSVVNTIAVGNSPTGVAVDDLISPPLALVVNSVDQTVSTINLATMTVVGSPLSVALSTATSSPLPFSVGINPITHRAIVTYQNAQSAAILDLSSGAPVLVEQVGGTSTLYGTGQSPAVAIDPRLNWAVVTPGGSGIGVTNIVDLGRNATPGVDVGRTPQLIAVVTLSGTTLGVGLNSETHQLLLTDPNAAVPKSFSLLNQSVNNISFTIGGITLNDPGLVAASANPLANIGIAVSGLASTAIVADLESGVVLQSISGLGSMPAAVAIDPASDEAVVANQGDGTVSIISLGAVRTPQILESTPVTTLTSSLPLTMTITGSGFTSGSAVRLDQVAVATATVPGSCMTVAPFLCRQLTATVPVTMLGSARRFTVDVLNADSTVSNVTDLSVIQAVVVGSSPVGVAVDTTRDLAVVTNSVDGTVSLVALSAQTPIFGGGTAGAVGTIGSPISVGAGPQGVAVSSRLGLAAVADNASDSVSVVDVTGAVGPSTDLLCAGCQPVAVAINGDTGLAYVTNTHVANAVNEGGVDPVSLSNGGIVGTNINIDQFPTGIAIDPVLDYAGVSASQTNAVDILNLATGGVAGPGRVSNFAVPAGVNYDSLNQVFLVANSAASTVIIVNPNLFLTTSISVGINPTSVEYDFQASTLLTVNSMSHSISVLDYDCPPSSVPNGCSNPKVRAVIGVDVQQVAANVLVGPNSIAIDPLLDLAAIVDYDNNRLLLVPIPH
jgi:DNA-binding beta-propeller fold protein YncE